MRVRQRRWGLQPRVGPRDEDLPWETEMDHLATAVVRGPIGEILPALCAPPT